MAINIEKCEKCKRERHHAQVWRSFEPKRNEWAYWRRCHWCGSLFSASRSEYKGL